MKWICTVQYDIKMGSKGGGGTNTVESTAAPPPYVASAYQNLLAQGNQVAATPYSNYTGPLVAGFNPDQATAMNTVASTNGMTVPFENAGAQYAAAGAQSIYPQLQQFNSQNLQQYMDPNTQNVINTTMAQINQNDAQQQSQLMGQAIQSGASPFGGDRAGVAAAALAGQQALANNQTVAGLNSQNYTQALNEFNNQQQLQANTQSSDAWRDLSTAQVLPQIGTTAQSNALGQASAQLQSGALQQQLQQEQLDVPYEQWAAQQAYPFQTTNFLGGLTEALGSGSGGTSSTTSPGASPLSQIGGLGVTGLGLYGALGGFGGSSAGAAATGGGLGSLFGDLFEGAALVKKGGVVGKNNHYDIGGVTLPTVPSVGISVVPSAQSQRGGNNIPQAPKPLSQQNPSTLSDLTQGAQLGKLLNNKSGIAPSPSSTFSGSNDLSTLRDQLAYAGNNLGLGNDAYDMVQNSADFGHGGVAGHYDMGGEITTPQQASVAGSNPLQQQQYSQYMNMPLDKLQQLAVAQPQNPIIQKILQMKKMGMGNSSGVAAAGQIGGISTMAYGGRAHLAGGGGGTAISTPQIATPQIGANNQTFLIGGNSSNPSSGVSAPIVSGSSGIGGVNPSAHIASNLLQDYSAPKLQAMPTPAAAIAAANAVPAQAATDPNAPSFTAEDQFLLDHLGEGGKTGGKIGKKNGGIAPKHFDAGGYDDESPSMQVLQNIAESGGVGPNNAAQNLTSSPQTNGIYPMSAADLLPPDAKGVAPPAVVADTTPPALPQPEGDLDAKPVVDHSGDTVKLHSEGKVIDTGIPSMKDTSIASSPWTPLIAAGLGIMSGKSPNALENIGTGGIYGLNAAMTQRENALKENQAQTTAELRKQEALQQQAYQQGELGLKKQELTSLTPYQQGQLDVERQKLTTMTPYEKAEIELGKFVPVKDVFGNVTGVMNAKTGDVKPVSGTTPANATSDLVNQSPSSDPQEAATQILAESGTTPAQVMSRQDITGRNAQVTAYNNASLSAKKAIQELDALNSQTGKYTPGKASNWLYGGESAVGMGGEGATARTEADKASKNLANAFMQANAGAKGSGIRMVEFDAGAVPNADMPDAARNDLIAKNKAVANSQIQRAAISNLYPHMQIANVNAIMDNYEEKNPPILPNGKSNPSWMPYTDWLKSGRPNTAVQALQNNTPASKVQPSSGAIQMLKQNPALAPQFEQKYGVPASQYMGQ